MKITVLVEGQSDKKFVEIASKFVKDRLRDAPKPAVESTIWGSRLPKRSELQDFVHRRLQDRSRPSQYVVALTDVHPDFSDAADAKEQLTRWAKGGDRFRAHAAQYELEAWLLPYWDVIRRRSGTNASPFGKNPETIDGQHPPKQRLIELYQAGERPIKYREVTELVAILKGQDLTKAANTCKELKGFLNTLLEWSGGETIP